MTKREITEKVNVIEHSFENALGVPSGTTELVTSTGKSTSVKSEDYDDKDDEIEEDFLDVYDKALDMYEVLLDAMDEVDSFNKSKIAEVAGSMLNTALASAEKRRVLKQHKDVLRQKEKLAANKSGKGKQINNNNLFIGTYQDALKLIDATKKEKSNGVDDENSTPAEFYDVEN